MTMNQNFRTHIAPMLIGSLADSHDHENNTPIHPDNCVRFSVSLMNDSLFIDFPDYFEMNGYAPIAIEVSNGSPRALVWDNINSETPTIISLESAHKSGAPDDAQASYTHDSMGELDLGLTMQMLAKCEGVSVSRDDLMKLTKHLHNHGLGIGVV